MGAKISTGQIKPPAPNTDEPEQSHLESTRFNGPKNIMAQHQPGAQNNYYSGSKRWLEHDLDSGRRLLFLAFQATVPLDMDRDMPLSFTEPRLSIRMEVTIVGMVGGVIQGRYRPVESPTTKCRASPMYQVMFNVPFISWASRMSLV